MASLSAHLMPLEKHSPNPYQSPIHAERDEKPSLMTRPAGAIIWRCGWLGAKVAFVVMAVVAVLLYLLFGGLIVYKSFQHQVSPLTVLKATEAPVQLLVIPSLMVVGVTAFSGLVGSLIGAAAVVVRYLSRLTRRRGRR
ncbi:MAG: hypothetical protein A2V70_07255 [Planctomycetes bacterium RBG_13_63_9]|nr:MAG: hypothetical protein A2V70_07255 [Planctomycetes bacterium RBG_13_63_9]